VTTLALAPVSSRNVAAWLSFSITGTRNLLLVMRIGAGVTREDGRATARAPTPTAGRSGGTDEQAPRHGQAADQRDAPSRLARYLGDLHLEGPLRQVRSPAAGRGSGTCGWRRSTSSTSAQ